MISRTAARIFRRATVQCRSLHTTASHPAASLRPRLAGNAITPSRRCNASQSFAFHTSPAQRAQSPTADALMEDLNELYATAKDEFEIAAEETEKKTVYAEDDREAAQDALKQLQEGFQRAVKESSPEVAKEVQSRVGPRIRELENAVKAMEEMAMED